MSGTLTAGTSTVTVSYGGKTTTFTVTVTQAVVPPLYQLEAFSDEISAFSISVTDVDHIAATSSANSRTAYIYNNKSIGLNPNPVAWFGVVAGDSYVLNLKNIAFSDNSDTDNRFAVAFKDSNGTTKIGSGDINVSTTGSGTIQDVTVSGTMESTESNLLLFVFVYRAVTINFDVELYVNNVRYV